MFKPLAWTNNLAIAMCVVLAITLVPAYLPTFIRGKIFPEQRHPVSRSLQRLYAPLLKWTLLHRGTVVVMAIGLLFSVIPVYQRMGAEFMPPLYEGTILYMPTTLPGLSVTEANRLLQIMDRKLRAFPEVEQVFGKAGRAETSTDPAPFSMMEVVVSLKSKDQWRPGLSYEGLIDEMDRALQLPGVTNAWTMPIKARIDMLTTGVRTPVGIKIFGPDLRQIEQIGEHLEMALKEVPGTRSVYAERVSGGYFLDFDINRDAIARYGLKLMDVGKIIETAIGGENIATTIEGRERYPINVRYLRELRDDQQKLQRVLVDTPIPFLLNDYPKQGPGCGNGNLMNHSTLAGIYWAQHHGYTHVLKTRTDITISNLDRLILRLNLYSHNQIGLLMWHKSYRHLVDQVMFGPIDKMLTMWNWQYIQCHTESQMMKEYFEKTQLDGSPEDLDNIKKHFHFFAKDTFITNSVIEWKKYDCPNIIWPYVYGLAEAIY